MGTGKSDIHCRIKETLLIRDLKSTLNENVASEKRFLCSNFLQTSMYVCHHHFLSIVIVFTCSLASSLFVDV